MSKIKIEDLSEYNGTWTLRDKNGICVPFTMVDLKELLAQQKEELIDNMVAEIFIMKDGILPIRNIFFKPNEIAEIRKTLEKVMEHRIKETLKGLDIGEIEEK